MSLTPFILWHMEGMEKNTGAILKENNPAMEIA